MQKLNVAVFTQSGELFSAFRKMIPSELGQVQQLARATAAVPTGTALVFVDGKLEGADRAFFEALAAHACYTVLVDDERHIGDGVPEWLVQGLVDDLLLTPIRAIEVLSKLKHVAHLEKVKEVTALNANLKTLIEKFEEDLRTARSIQRTLIPEKFDPVPGMKMAHRYLSGLKSGGDYLDFFEFEDKTHVGILMSDSTGYGLSSAFMSVILKLAVKMSRDGFRSPSATITSLFEELQLTMKPKEDLSLFYGILNRKTFELTYATAGSIRFVHQNEKSFEELVEGGAPLQKEQKRLLTDHKLRLEPGDRIVVFSDGFGDAFKSEGRKGVARAFEKSFGEDPVALINEMVFRVKQSFEAEDDMPEQDCSVMILDVEKRAMRLAK